MGLIFAGLLLAQSVLAANIYFPHDQSNHIVSDRLATKIKLPKLSNQNQDTMNLDQSQNQLGRLCELGLVNLDDSCYKPFTQGPCDQNQYVYQSPKESYARCVKNPCKEPNTFPYQNRGCFKINVRSEACAAEDQVLLVDVATHQLQCAETPLENGVNFRSAYSITGGVYCHGGKSYRGQYLPKPNSQSATKSWGLTEEYDIENGRCSPTI